MSLSSSTWRLATVVLTALATVASVAVLAAPAEARNRVTPGSFTGYGFDQCIAPSQQAMDTWLRTSPYWAVGIYIAGVNRYCGDDKQVNLDADWVSTQLANGWRLLPLTVGLQASCSSVDRYRGKKISPDPTANYATARAQGRTEARTTVRAARRLGIPEASTLWYDIEHFTGGTRCRESALSFLSAWTRKLHALGYASGVYSSASSGIKLLDDAQYLTPGRYAMPDQVWIADWNGSADVESDYVRPESWMPHRRIHQYLGGHDETYGGVTINIDANYLDLGRGSVAPREPGHCGGVSLNAVRYRSLSAAERGAQVKVAQCLLRQRHFYRGRLRYLYTPRTERAVSAYQEARDLPVNGRMTRRTWTALLSEGPKPVLKIGSASHAVRRAQRALNAATRSRLLVTGVFDDATTLAVRDYQLARDLPPTGVIAEDTWADLAQGRR